MKRLVLVIMLLMSSYTFCTEKVIYIKSNSQDEVVRKINEWLNKGWKVKIMSPIFGYGVENVMYVVFTDEK